MQVSFKNLSLVDVDVANDAFEEECDQFVIEQNLQIAKHVKLRKSIFKNFNLNAAAAKEARLFELEREKKHEVSDFLKTGRGGFFACKFCTFCNTIFDFCFSILLSFTTNDLPN